MTAVTGLAGPLSAAQRDIWYADRYGTGAGYRLALALTIEGALDTGRLTDAVDAVVAAQPVLRSRFADGPDGPVRIEDAALGGWFGLVDGRPPVPELAPGGPLFAVRAGRVAPDVWSVTAAFSHLIFDGTSRDLFVRQLLAAYAGEVLPPAPPYAEYVAGEPTAPPAGVLQNGEPGGGFDPDPDGGSDAGRRARPPLDLDVAALDALAARLGVRRHTVLTASFAALLDRYAAAPDATAPAIAIPLNARPERFGSSIGPFVNELPVRPAVTGSFADLVAATDVALQQVKALRSVPGALLRPRGGGRPAPVVLGYRRAAEVPAEVAGLRVTYHRSLPLPGHRADLEVQVVGTATALTGWLRGDPARLGVDRIRRLAAHWTALIPAVCGEPDRPLSDVDAMPAGEQALLTALATGPQRRYAGAGTLGGLVTAQAARTPDASAVRVGPAPDAPAVGELTYAELHRRAGALAGRLLAAGARPEVPVAVLVARSAELVVALLGVVLAGVPVLPIDADNPPQRVADLLADSAPDLLVTDDDAVAAEFAGTVVRPGGDLPPDAPRPHEPGPDDIAYVLYTSGSTGAPKAVTVPHRAIRNRLLWAQDTYGLTSDDRVLHKTSIGFDVAVWEVFWPLLAGTPIVLAEPGGHRDSGYLARLIQDEHVTTVHFVPSMLRAFLDEPAASGCRSLRRVLCSGEELPTDLAARFHATLPGVALHNLYGPTEAAIDVTATPVPPGTAPVTIGRPLANAVVAVLDRHRRPAPLGTVGELYLGGVPLATGYRGRPDLTADRFADGWYRTGDLGRHRPDGTIEYHGRVDRQVKIRGQRVEPGEIEAAMAACPGVRRAAVTFTGGRLLGYYVEDAVGGPGGDGLLRWLRERLPGAMVPAAVVALDAFPTTANGKLDRSALPVPDAAAPAGAPQRDGGTTEQVIAALWADLLGRASVGPDDDFFALGGDSLLVTRTLAGIRAEFEVDLPFRTVFDLPTVAGLAAAVDAAGHQQLRVDG